MTRITPTRLLIVDDNEVYRSSLEMLLELEPGVEIVGLAATGAGALAEAATVNPDVALVDYRLPDMNGAELTAALRSAHPDLLVVCLTAEIAPHEHDAVLAAGAADVVEKGASVERLVTSLSPRRG
jgi:DNA-binding NarL/FixJ family response regulator